MIESLLLTAARITTHQGDRTLTDASGFFFEHAGRLFLVSSRHVMLDEPSEHLPDRLEIELHTDAENLARSVGWSIPLYRNGLSLWRDATDTGGPIDVAAIALDREAMPASAVLRAFTADLIGRDSDGISVGDPALIVGFPLAFHDQLHHMPVVRQAGIASSFGLRFQGQGYFLTDARTHRGSSGAPVVARRHDADGSLPWRLLGVHSSRIDVGGRDLALDEALGLNAAWYADVLPTLCAG